MRKDTQAEDKSLGSEDVSQILNEFAESSSVCRKDVCMRSFSLAV